MDEAVTSQCPTHGERSDCPDALLTYSFQRKEYGILIHDGGSSRMDIDFCPFCGKRLSKTGASYNPTIEAMEKALLVAEDIVGRALECPTPGACNCKSVAREGLAVIRKAIEKTR
jgi:hypothetical protein